MMDIFKNVKLTSQSLDSTLSVKDGVFAVKPTKGTQEDFDFIIGFDPDTFMGFDAKDVKVVGSGYLYKDTEKVGQFDFEAPVSTLRVSFQFETAPENKLNANGKQITLKSFDFEVDES